MDEYLIYPKQFQRVNIPVEKSRCFVIMPFKDDMDYIYGAIKQGLNRAGFICNRVDEIGGATPIINKILTEILRSRYIVADLTDCNPNVFYELGIAHSFKDAQNIIILKQRGSKVPFDITHLTYIEYDPDNLKYLTSSILKNISMFSYLADFREALNIRGIIPYVKDNEDFFIEYLEQTLNSDINTLISVLNNEISKFTIQDIESLLSKYEYIIGKAITDNQNDVIDGLLNVYQEIIITLSKYDITEEFVIRFLDGTFWTRYHVAEEKVVAWKTNMAISLAKANKMLAITIPWIIRYFSQTKTAAIDLNRYKLEAFLMTSDNNIVNETICNTIFDKNCYIREHMADIIGEKRLQNGLKNLTKQLSMEDNYFTAVSIMEAIGKLRDNSAIPFVLEWINNNDTEIISQKQFFVLKHARIVLAKLVSASNSKHLKDFDVKYGDFLKDYFIL